MARRRCVWHKPSFGELTYSHGSKRTCQTTCTIHFISSQPWCVNSYNGSLLTLSMDRWLYEVFHYQCHSHICCFICNKMTCLSLNLFSCSLQITFLAAFTSAPFPSRISTTSLCPLYADMYKAVAPFWGTQHVQQMQTKIRGWSRCKCQTISISCCFHSGQHRHTIDQANS